jgi:hypothetical protein
MSGTAKKPTDAYEVGYGKPPVTTRFQKGRSGNPKGRRKRTPQAEIEDLFIKEYLRPIKVREGDRVQTMPAIQVIMRAEINKGVKGSGPAQRSALRTARTARQIGRDWQTRHEAMLQAAIEFQVTAERECMRAEQEGRPDNRALLDPNAVDVDLSTGDVRFRMPGSIAKREE